MNLHVITVLACMALFREVTCLQCYECSTTPGLQDTAGCTPGLPMDDQFLVTCAPTEIYCVTTEVKAFLNDGRNVTNIILSCQSTIVLGCKNDNGSGVIDYSTSCFTSCETDGCNAHPLPASTTQEVTKTPEVITKPKVTAMPDAKQTPVSIPTSTDAPKPVPDTARPKLTKFTDAPKTTTSAAQAMNMHTLSNFFVSVMCALLLSGLIRND